jgi:hypothetical protein
MSDHQEYRENCQRITYFDTRRVCDFTLWSLQI